jgi:hypothetical protein
MAFFRFEQNNSGGAYDITDMVHETVIIEADNAEQANERAKSIGIYFDGVADGRDCDCCGNRWYPMINRNGTFVPYTDDDLKLGPYQNPGVFAIVHYADGRIETVHYNEG